MEFRASFTTGRIPPHKDALLAYLTQSAAYYALIIPVVEFVLARPPGYACVIAWAVLVFIGPAFIGFLLGLNARYGFTRTFLGWLGPGMARVVDRSRDAGGILRMG